MLAMLRLATEVGTAASWIFIFIAAVTAVFALYVGAAMYAVYHAATRSSVTCCGSSAAGGAGDHAFRFYLAAEAGPSALLFARAGGTDHPTASGRTQLCADLRRPECGADTHPHGWLTLAQVTRRPAAAYPVGEGHHLRGQNRGPRSECTGISAIRTSA